MSEPNGDVSGADSLEELLLLLVQLIQGHDSRSVARKSHLGLGTVGRLRSGQRPVTRDTVGAIAAAYAPDGSAPWVERYDALSGSPGARHAPYELPSDVPALLGRAGKLTVLARQLAGVRRGHAVPACAVVVGAAGVGKTAFAVHWAHRVARRFPDGVLYLDLQGFGPKKPMSEGAALASLLRSLDVEDADIPASTPERVRLYRTAVAGRRMLVLLDNAADAAQVRPLLPNTRASFTVVTGRSDLAGLRDIEGAAQIELTGLSKPDSVDLLRMALGASVDASPEARDAVVEYCAGLPLALRLAAGQALDRHGGLPSLSAALAHDRSLSVLDPPQGPGTDLRAVISFSYQRLPAGVARLLRLLGTGPVRTWDALCAAALSGTEVPEAAAGLEALFRAHLVERNAGGRYSLLDPLRAFAWERAQHEEDATARHEAVVRTVRYYVAAGAAAARATGAGPAPGTPATAHRGDLPAFADAEQASRWFDLERENLIAVVGEAADRHEWEAVGLLASAWWDHLHRDARYADGVRVHTLAIDASRTTGSVEAEAGALEHRGIAQQMLGRYDTALDDLARAAALYGRSGDLAREGRVSGHIGTVYARRGDNQVAIEWMERARRVAEESGDRLATLNALNNVGLVYQRWGRYERARGPLQAALNLAEALGDLSKKGLILNNLSLVHQSLGALAEARQCVDEALRLAASDGGSSLLAQARDTLGALLVREAEYSGASEQFELALGMHRAAGDRAAAAETLDNMGVALGRAGRHGDALVRHEDALTIAEEIGDRGRAASALLGCGREARATGRGAAARDCFQRAAAIARELENAEQSAEASAGLARLAADDGDTGEANRLWRDALRQYPSLDRTP